MKSLYFFYCITGEEVICFLYFLPAITVFLRWKESPIPMKNLYAFYHLHISSLFFTFSTFLVSFSEYFRRRTLKITTLFWGGVLKATQGKVCLLTPLDESLTLLGKVDFIRCELRLLILSINSVLETNLYKYDRDGYVLQPERIRLAEFVSKPRELPI